MKSFPFTVNVTISPSFTSPPTVPVTGISCPDSAAFITSSSVIFGSKVIVALKSSSNNSTFAVSISIDESAPTVLTKLTIKSSVFSNIASLIVAIFNGTSVAPAGITTVKTTGAV